MPTPVLVPRRVLWVLPAIWLEACCVIAVHLVQGNHGYAYAGHRVVPVDHRPHGYRMQGGDDAMIGASTFTPATSSVAVRCAGQGSEVLLATAPSGPPRTAGTRAVRAVGAGGLVLLGVLSSALALGFGLQQRRTKQVPRASYRP